MPFAVAGKIKTALARIFTASAGDRDTPALQPSVNSRTVHYTSNGKHGMCHATRLGASIVIVCMDQSREVEVPLVESITDAVVAVAGALNVENIESAEWIVQFGQFEFKLLFEDDDHHVELAYSRKIPAPLDVSVFKSRRTLEPLLVFRGQLGWGS